MEPLLEQQVIETAFSLQHLTTLVIVIIIIGLIVGLDVIAAKLRRRNANTQIEESYVHTGRRVFKFIKALIAIVGILVVLEVNDIDVGGLATGLGVAGIVVAYAIQDLLSDLAMGARIVSDKYFKMGDIVLINGIEGEVVSLAPRSTKIRSIVDGSLFTFSNREIVHAQIQPEFMNIDFAFRYETPLDVADAATAEIVRRLKLIEGITDAEDLGTQNMADSAIQRRIRFYGDPKQRYILRRKVNRTIQEVFADMGLSMPYPHIELVQG